MSDLKQDSPAQQGQPAWQRIGIRAARILGVGAAQFAGSFAVAFAALAVADTVTTSPTAHRVVALGIIGAAAALGWLVLLRRGFRSGRHRHPSINSQAHNLSSRALNWRFRRG